MKWTTMVCAAAALVCGMLAFAQSKAEVAAEILALERQAMDGWLKGNPDLVLALMDPEITYFHIMTEKRIDGLPSVKALFESYRGTPLFDSYEIVEPKVQASGDTAILTYLLVRRGGGGASRWNATQVYQHKKEGWRVIHAHWSQTKPPITSPATRDIQ
jgi:ketosteroid isomerase-like protein